MLHSYLNKAIMEMESYETGENARIRFGDISDNFTNNRMHPWTCVPVKWVIKLCMWEGWWCCKHNHHTAKCYFHCENTERVHFFLCFELWMWCCCELPQMLRVYIRRQKKNGTWLCFIHDPLLLGSHFQSCYRDQWEKSNLAFWNLITMDPYVHDET